MSFSSQMNSQYDCGNNLLPPGGTKKETEKTCSFKKQIQGANKSQDHLTIKHRAKGKYILSKSILSIFNKYKYIYVATMEQ